MNILVINGSPKGQKSNTLKLTHAFLDGLNQSGMHSTEAIDIIKNKLNHVKVVFPAGKRRRANASLMMIWRRRFKNIYMRMP
ncbi:MAG: NAD(P)H-dependent oxidoreductase [Treponema sp.]|jgi:multimeric flavodoxin WrbA|nr:NAD(P)H-dependent oxidoreductase [Treponema sp.]